MMSAGIKIMLVEDNKGVGITFTKIVNREGITDKFLWVQNLKDAQYYYRNNKDSLRIIFVDGQLHGQMSTYWVEQISEEFRRAGGLLIAYSGQYNRQLIASGCIQAIEKADLAGIKAILSSISEDKF